MGTLSADADVVIQPGELFFGSGHRCVRTLLGSCVAITFWQAKRRLGGMCHYLLPTRSPDITRPGLDGRYGAEALALLHAAMVKAETRPHEYLVKIFGGGNMFPRMRVGAEGLVGARNVMSGRRLLLEMGFSIASEDVAGTGYRVVELDLGNGEVRVNYHDVERPGRRLRG